MAGIALSIVVVNHDYAHYLPAAIDGALAQTASGVEVVVVDDGSTDGSPEVIAGYGDRVVPVLKANGGQASAINAGFRATRGRAVVFLDADDLLYPDAAQVFLCALSTPDASKAQGVLDVIDADATPTGARIPSRPSAQGDLRARVLARGPGSYVCPPCSGNAWARTFLDAVMPLPEQPREMAGDNYLTDTAPLFGRVVDTGRRVGAYRSHGASMTDRRAGMDVGGLGHVLTAHRERSGFLAEVAARQGEALERERWQRESWRHVAVRELLWRAGGRIDRPRYRDFLAAVRAHRPGLLKTAALGAWGLSVRVLPLRLALASGARVIRPEHLL